MGVLVTGISWNRTYFQLDYECDAGEELLLYRAAEHTFIPFASYEREQVGDRERVHASDVKKLFSWYNVLLDAKLFDAEN